MQVRSAKTELFNVAYREGQH